LQKIGKNFCTDLMQSFSVLIRFHHAGYDSVINFYYFFKRDDTVEIIIYHV